MYNIYICKERQTDRKGENYFKKSMWLFIWLWGLASLSIGLRLVGWRFRWSLSEIQASTDMQSWEWISQGSRLEVQYNFYVVVLRRITSLGNLHFLSCFQLIGWDPPTLCVEWFALLKVYECKCPSHLKNTFTVASRLMFDQTTSYCSPTKLTHQVNHHLLYLVITN